LPVAAVLGCVQPAIDPVFLTLLSSATGLDTGHHGWVVGMTQTASALAALCVWWLGPRMPMRAVIVLALGAMMAAFLSPLALGLPGVLALRAMYGLGMGRFMPARWAALRPGGQRVPMQSYCWCN
jgi:MFS family permease